MRQQRGYLVGLFLAIVMIALSLGNLARGDIFADVMAKTRAAVCIVRGHNGGPEKHVGTGCLIGPSLVLSADHVLEGCRYAECIFGGQTIQAKTEFHSASCDSVLIVLERPATIQPLELSPGISNPRGEVYLAGFRSGKLRYFNGIGDGRTWRNQQGQRVLSVISASYEGGEPGNSGGPAFDGQGRVLGNISSSNWANGARDNTMVVHPATLQKFLQRVEQRYPGTCPPGIICPPGINPPIQPPSQPPPQCTLEIDYQKLIELMVADGRFKGEDGKDGIDGKDGDNAVVDYEKIIAAVIERLPDPTPVDYEKIREMIREELANLPPMYLQPSYYAANGQLAPEGSPIELRLGETAPLPPVAMRIIGASGQETFTQGANGGTMNWKLADVLK